MFNKLIKNKRVLVALAAVAALAVAGIAYGYLTATGNGSGSGTATAKASAMTYTTSVPALTTLGDTQTITISASQTGSGSQAAGTLNVSVLPVNALCPADSFTLASPTVTSTTEVPNSNTPTVVGTDSVTFNDRPAAQDTCVTDGYTITVTS